MVARVAAFHWMWARLNKPAAGSRAWLCVVSEFSSIHGFDSFAHDSWSSVLDSGEAPAVASVLSFDPLGKAFRPAELVKIGLLVIAGC